MTSIKKEDWLLRFKENMAALCHELDNTGNWLNDNRPPGMSENELESFLESMRSFGEIIVMFGLLVRICSEASERSR